MDLRRLRIFVAVVDAGTFTAAADDLFLAQPSVSLAVRELETELGAELLVRSRTGVSLTPAGRELLPRARTLLQDVEAAADAVRSVDGLLSGSLHVMALKSLIAVPVAGILGRFRAHHPAVSLRLTGADGPGELIHDVRTGRVDVAITEAGGDLTDLVSTPLLRQRIVAVGPGPTDGGQGPGTDQRRPRSITRLAQEPLVLPEVGSSLRTLVDVAFRTAGVTPNVVLDTDQRDALVPLVRAGVGTTFVPESELDGSVVDGLQVFLPRPAMSRDLVLLARRGATVPAVGRLIELALEVRSN